MIGQNTENNWNKYVFPKNSSDYLGFEYQDGAGNRIIRINEVVISSTESLYAMLDELIAHARQTGCTLIYIADSLSKKLISNFAKYGFVEEKCSDEYNTFLSLHLGGEND